MRQEKRFSTGLATSILQSRCPPSSADPFASTLYSTQTMLAVETL